MGFVSQHWGDRSWSWSSAQAVVEEEGWREEAVLVWRGLFASLRLCGVGCAYLSLELGAVVGLELPSEILQGGAGTSRSPGRGPRWSGAGFLGLIVAFRCCVRQVPQCKYQVLVWRKCSGTQGRAGCVPTTRGVLMARPGAGPCPLSGWHQEDLSSCHLKLPWLP